MENELILLILAVLGNCCMADITVVAPTPAGPVGNPYDTSTDRPFLIKQFPLSSMRYQQVYNASAFTNVNPGCILGHHL